MKSFHIIAGALLACAGLACTVLACTDIRSELVDGQQIQDEGQRICVNFSGHAQRPVKGVLCTNEDRVCELNVWCYLDGRLDAFCYDENNICKVRLYDGREYVVLAMANMGRLQPPMLLSEAMDSQYGLPSLSSDLFKDALPMSTASAVTLNTGSTDGQVSLELSRLLSKYNLKILRQEGSVSKLDVTSVQVKNSPTGCFLFKENTISELMEAGGLTDGDLVVPEGQSSSVTLYLAENPGGSRLNADVNSYIEIKGKLHYEDRPSTESVYILNQDMTYRWYLKDGVSGNYGVLRNCDYSATFTWSDFGWLADPGHVFVDEVVEDRTFSITFCDRDGIPLGGAEYDNLEQSSIIDVYFKLVPESEIDNITIATGIPPQQLHLSFLGGPEAMGNGLFRQRISNNIERELSSEMTITLTNEVRGISCSTKIRLKGRGNCVQDWDENNDENIYF